MVAPIAVEALVTLPQNPFDQFLCWWLCRWGCGRRRAFPAFRAGSGSGGSAAGRQSRSSTYPSALCFVHLPRRAIAMALMLALLVVEDQPSPDAGLSLGDAAIGVQVDLLVFEAAPQPLDEDVVHVAPLAIHANRDLVPAQHAGEVVAGELAALVGVEDLRPTKASERFLERLNAKIGAERVRQLPGQHRAAVPVHDRYQVEKAPGHRDVSDVGAPDLVSPGDRQAAEQVGIGLVRDGRLARIRSLVDGDQPQQAHQTLDPLT